MRMSISTEPVPAMTVYQNSSFTPLWNGLGQTLTAAREDRS